MPRDLMPHHHHHLSANDMFRSFIDNANWTDSFPDHSIFHHLSHNMRTDIKEESDKYLLEIDLPGCDKKDIAIEYQDHVLTITVNRSRSIDEKAYSTIRQERYQGQISRSFHIDNIIHEKISAEYTNGVLILVLPKNKHNDSRRQIPIQ